MPIAPVFPFNYIQRRRASRHALKPAAVAKISSHPYINPQIASPLFTTLPAELRNQIFYFALLAYPDPACPYSPHSFWYRPGYTHARTIATNLLLTCRRIYLETNILAVINNEHIIWGVERSRIPPGPSSPYLLNDRMKLSQRNAVQYVHLFAQQFWLEVWKDKWLAFSQSWPDDCPPRLRITIRHTDWWYDLLGEKSPLALDPKRKGRARAGDWVGSDDEFEKGSWGSRFANLSGLKVLELELETIESKTAELDATVDQARSWKFPLRDGNVLILDESVTETSNWTGSRHFKGFNAPSVPAALQSWHGRSKMTVGSPTATPAGAAASASRQASFSALGPATTNPRTHSESLEELAPEHTLDYYVVLLSWRAREPNPDSEPGCLESPTASPTTSPATARAPVVHGPRTTFSSGSVIPTYYGTG